MRLSTLRGAMGTGLPDWSETSWMTCKVTSAVQGAAVAVEKSGVRIMSGSVKAPEGLSAQSPVMVCRKIEFGR